MLFSHGIARAKPGATIRSRSFCLSVIDFPFATVLDCGVHHLDSSNMYGWGHNED